MPYVGLVAVDCVRRADQVIGLAGADEGHRVRVAAGQGALPDDPRLLAPVVRVARLRLPNVRRLRTIAVLTGTGWVALSVWLPTHGRPVAVVLVAMAASYVALCLLRPVQLEARLDRLQFAPARAISASGDSRGGAAYQNRTDDLLITRVFPACP